MKSRLLTALLSIALGLNTALLIVTVVKLERVERRVGPGGSDEGRSGASMLFGLPRVDPEALDLTPEQHEEIRRLREEWHEEEAGRRRESIERRREIPELFGSDEVSMERLMPLLDRAHEDSRARLAAVVELYRQYQEILTPEQQERFKQLIREQQERHRSRWERYRERDHRWGGRDGERREGDERSGRYGKEYPEGRQRMRGETGFDPEKGIDPRPRRPGGDFPIDPPPLETGIPSPTPASP